MAVIIPEILTTVTGFFNTNKETVITKILFAAVQTE